MDVEGKEEEEEERRRKRRRGRRRWKRGRSSCSHGPCSKTYWAAQHRDSFSRIKMSAQIGAVFQKNNSPE